jgi:hypothetical protein
VRCMAESVGKHDRSEVAERFPSSRWAKGSSLMGGTIWFLGKTVISGFPQKNSRKTSFWMLLEYLLTVPGVPRTVVFTGCAPKLKSALQDFYRSDVSLSEATFESRSKALTLWTFVTFFAAYAQ